MAKRQLTAVQTSGGKGTRLRPLSLYSPTSIVPKGLIRIMGIPLAEEQLEDFRRVRIGEVYIITQYLENREHISSRFGDGTQFGLRIHYSRPSDDLINNGSGDAILRNIERHGLTGDSIWLANDNLYEYETERVVEQHRDLGAVVTILATRVPARDTIMNYGIIDADAKHRVRHVFEKPENEANLRAALGVTNSRELDDMRVLINTGGYVLNNDALAELAGKKWMVKKRTKKKGFDMAGRLIPELIEHGYPVQFIPIDTWGDFGSTTFLLDTFPKALSGMFPSIYNILSARGYYHDPSNNVWIHPSSYAKKDEKGRTLADRIKSGRVKIGPNVFIGGESIIGDGAYISFSDIEDYCEIGKGARLERVYMLPYCSIGPSAELSDCALGFEVRVGSSKRSPTHINGRSVIGPSITIPPGTRLDDVVINPGYEFATKGKTYSRVTLNPSDEQSARIVRDHRR